MPGGLCAGGGLGTTGAPPPPPSATLGTHTTTTTTTTTTTPTHLQREILGGASTRTRIVLHLESLEDCRHLLPRQLGEEEAAGAGHAFGELRGQGHGRVHGSRPGAREAAFGKDGRRWKGEGGGGCERWRTWLSAGLYSSLGPWPSATRSILLDPRQNLCG